MHRTGELRARLGSDNHPARRLTIDPAHDLALFEVQGAPFAAGLFLVFQLDGTAYPGNSGSPVYDAATGKVVGIVNSVLVKGTKESGAHLPERHHLRHPFPEVEGASAA